MQEFTNEGVAFYIESDKKPVILSVTRTDSTSANLSPNGRDEWGTSASYPESCELKFVIEAGEII